MGAASRSLMEFFPTYRASNPVLDEQVRLTVVGLPEGALRRRMQRVLFIVIVLTMAAAILGAFSSGPYLVWTVAGAFALIVFAFVLVPARDLPLGIVVSDRRVLLAQQRRRQDPKVVAELPPTSLSHVTMDANAERFWYSGRLCRLTMSGPDGVIAVIELVAFDPGAARILFDEAGIDVASPPTTAARRGHSDGSGADVRFWFPKAFVVGFLYFVGGGFLLLAIPVGLDEGPGSGIAVLGVAAVLLAAGEGLRRILFRRRPG